MNSSNQNQSQKLTPFERDAYLSNFSLDFSEKLAIYKRLKWSVSYFLAQWDSNAGTYAAGTIRRYNHIFHVQFCAGCTLGKLRILAAENPNKQITLSFRKAENNPAYVLVSFTSQI